MPLGKDSAGRTRGPSSAQRAENARKAAAMPLRRVVVSGVGWDDRHPQRDVDVCECGHVLRAARDLVGRRWPARRRCRKCANGVEPDLTEQQVNELAKEA